MFSGCWTKHAAAYSLGSLASEACHERLTLNALRAVRADVATARPSIAPTGGEQALVDDMPIEMPDDLDDFEAATLVLSNRDIDLNGVEPGALTELATVQADPDRQTQSCLRRAEHDDPGGGLQALGACREFIASKVRSAVQGLRSDGTLDASTRTTFDAVLNMRGPVEVSLPRFWVEMGRALHTLQDGFSHTYRSHGDQLQVVTVTNFIDLAEDRLVEERDGPPHVLALDECEDLDELRTTRWALAELASEELMRAALETAASADERTMRAQGVLDRYLSPSPNAASCSAANNWCDAPERQYEDSACVCSLSGRRDGRAAPWLAGLAVFLVFTLRRATARARRSLAFALGAIALYAGPARALEKDSLATDADRRAATSERSPFGVEIKTGASLTHGAFAVSLGGRYRVSSRFLAGVDAEYNPWFSLSVGNVRSGTTNFYASGILRFPMHSEKIALRATLELGIARMNFPLVGVPEGSVGPFIGFNLLGIDYALSRTLSLVLNPAHIAIPMPQLAEVPFAYMQYRITIGLQYGA
jgi:hypothetical protein